MVVESPLVIVGHCRTGLPLEQVVGQFQQVEGTAVLAIITRQVLALRLRLEQMLLVTHLARHEGMFRSKGPEQQFGSRPAVLMAE